MFLALALVAAPLLAALGPELQLSTPAIEPAPFNNRIPAVASNGTDFLVVWNGRDSRIHAARVDDRGAVVDAQRLTIAQRAGTWPISVASDGRDYVVSYSEGRSLRLAGVDAMTGAVTPGALLDDTTEGAIASNGRGYLVAYKRGARLEAMAVDANAAIVGGPYSLGFTESSPRIASNGEAYLVVSQLTRSDLTAKLVADGVVRRTETVTLATRTDAPFSGWAVASDGDGFLVAWSANGGAFGTPAMPFLRVRAFAADGTPAGPPQTVVDADATEPAVSWNGSQYLVTYTHGLRVLPHGDSAGDVRGLAVDAAGAVGAPIELAARAGGEMESAVATNGAETLVVWARRNGFDGVIEGRLLDGPTRVISTGLAWQESVAAAPHRSGTVVAWSEITGDEQRRQIFVQRLDARGIPRDGRGIPVHESPRAQYVPAVAGSLVTWMELEPSTIGSSVWAKMLDASGAPYGEAFKLGSNGHGPAIAVAGNAHLVVWNTLHGDGIMAVRVDPFAQAISEPIFVSRGGSDRDVAVASDGSGFLVTWLRDRRPGGCFDCYPLQSVQAVAVTRWGVVVGPPVELTERDEWIGQPIPVWNGSDYAVFWSQEQSRTLHGRRVRRNGLPVMAAPLVMPEAELRGAGWSGEEYRIVVRHGQHDIVRLDRDFRVLERTTIDSAIHDWPAPVVLVNGFLLYLSPNGGSRAVARRLRADFVGGG